MTDVQALAATLFDTVKALQAHIEARAADLAAERLRELEERYDTATAAMERTSAAAQQRHEDLIAEMRRQLTAQERQVLRAHELLRQNGVDPRTGAALTRGGAAPLITGLARELWAGERAYRHLTAHGWELLSEEERARWERAATHALESYVDHIIEAGRPVWWTTE